MSNAVLDGRTVSEVSARAKDVREELRTLGEVLESLRDEVMGQSPAAGGKLEQMRIHVARAIEAGPCTDTSQLPF